jgi:hypothetical protein
MRIAGYQNISATACMIKLPPSHQPVKTHSILQIDQEKVRKIYIPLYLNNIRTIGCMDSGSDITILQEGLLREFIKTNGTTLNLVVSHTSQPLVTQT